MRSDPSSPQIQTQSTNEQPKLGALRGQAWLTVQTRQAQRLIRGRNGSASKSAIIGLVGFADRLRVIWQAARNDDPYADWWLIKIHEALENARQFIQTQQDELDRGLDQMKALEITIAESLHPYRVPLQFANPYAYHGAHLIAAYDTLVRTVLSSCHVGLLDSESTERTINLCARRIRGTFAIPQGYRFLGIDREVLHQGIGKCERARQLMGEVPIEVLSGEKRAPLVPLKLKFPTQTTQHMILAPVSMPAKVPIPDDENDND